MHVDASSMPYTIVRSGPILTLLVTHPTPVDMPRAIADIQTCLDKGGVSEVQVGYDEDTWRTAWAACTLTAFETSMRQLGFVVRVLGSDQRLASSRPR